LHFLSSGSSDHDKAANAKKNKGADRASYENSHFAADDDDNIVFEDFARLRLNEPDE
jgi:arrestin-2